MLPPWHREGYRYEKPGFMWRWFKKLPPLKEHYKMKPKRPEVQAAMRLPPAHRIRVLNAAAPPLLASAGGPA